MEYLMTYGWAIIIVVVVFIALLRLGVFTPSAGTVATGFNEFTLGTDFKIDTLGTATLMVTNADKQSRAVTLASATVDGNDCTGDTGRKGPGQVWTVTCLTATAGGSVGAPYAGIPISLDYSVGGLNHTDTGTISGEYELSSDITGPGSVTGLGETSLGQTWVYWTWTNPTDADFDYVEVWVDGSPATNTDNNYYNATGFATNTTHTIGTRTVDIYANVNPNWVNDTATTT